MRTSDIDWSQLKVGDELVYDCDSFIHNVIMIGQEIDGHYWALIRHMEEAPKVIHTYDEYVDAWHLVLPTPQESGDPMTLEELQAEFPTGTRWTTMPVGGDYTIVGAYIHPMEHMGLTLVISDKDGRLSLVDPDRARASYRRIPDEVPCPITETETFRLATSARMGGDRTLAEGNYGVKVTLHPAEPGATEGRYTWRQP